MVTDIFDEFTLSPNSGGGSGKPVPDGPEIIDRTGDAPAGEEEIKKEEKVEEKVETKETKPKAKAKEEEKVESKEEDKEEEKEEEEDEVDLTDFAGEVYNELGFEGEFDKEEFTKEFGGKDLKAVLNFVKRVIDENSKVVHPNEEAARYYDYVANGGDPRRLSHLLDIQSDFNSVNAEDLSENEDLQRGVLRAYLRELNPKKSAEWIEEELTDYMDSGLAPKKSVKALEDLKEISKEKIQNQLKEQETRKAEEKRQNKEYWDNIQTVISTSETIGGIKIDKAGKDKLFKNLQSGVIANFAKDPKKLLELALVAQAGGLDKIVEKQGMTKAVNKVEAVLSRYNSKGTKVKSQTLPHVTEGESKKLFNPDDWSFNI